MSVPNAKIPKWTEQGAKEIEALLETLFEGNDKLRIEGMSDRSVGDYTIRIKSREGWTIFATWIPDGKGLLLSKKNKPLLEVFNALSSEPVPSAIVEALTRRLPFRKYRLRQGKGLGHVHYWEDVSKQVLANLAKS